MRSSATIGLFAVSKAFRAYISGEPGEAIAFSGFTGWPGITALCGVEGCGVEEIHIEGVSVEDAWARLKADSASVLIDVRTIAEWAYVGLPDLDAIGKRPVLVEWQGFPGDRPNTAFVERLSETLRDIGANKDCELLFICRSGSRSLKAARAMAAAGYRRCRNVTEGFEGPLDPVRHRGQVAGWKARGLPWAQG